MSWTDLPTAKTFLRVDTDDEDGLITLLIGAAQSQIESYTGLYLTPVQVSVSVATWDDLKSLRVGPVASVSALTYLDTTATAQSLGADQYRLSINDLAVGILPMPGLQLPVTLDAPDAITVLLNVGYPDGQIPGALMQALFLALGDAYSFRENTVADRSVTPTELPGGVMSLITNYRIW